MKICVPHKGAQTLEIYSANARSVRITFLSLYVRQCHH